MAKFAIRYAVQKDGNGLAIIEESGRCQASDRAGIEAGCTWRYQMVVLPQASGAILKAMDGTSPIPVLLRPTTFSGQAYTCVKVGAWANPLAPQQTGGTYNGSAILQYTIRWQEVGGVA